MKPYLSVKEAATILGLHEQTIREKIKSNQLKAFKTCGVNGSWRIKQEDLEEFAKYTDFEKEEKDV